ncbi:hypothetical protein MHU86_19239 [Fragilaria crotonensis]|nr:hypothetical protein MHU86_19239 [Fragilaria crotonensis]
MQRHGHIDNCTQLFVCEFFVFVAFFASSALRQFNPKQAQSWSILMATQWHSTHLWLDFTASRVIRWAVVGSSAWCISILW